MAEDLHLKDGGMVIIFSSIDSAAGGVPTEPFPSFNSFDNPLAHARKM